MMSRLSITMTLTAGLMLLCGATAFVQNGHEHGSSAGNTAKRADDALIVCPVGNTELPKRKAFPLAYRETTYYLCCKMCVAPFQARPAKYLKAAARYADPAHRDRIDRTDSDRREHSGHREPSGCGGRADPQEDPGADGHTDHHGDSEGTGHSGC